jgi:polar amino acid transport system substrate-binding protein
MIIRPKLPCDHRTGELIPSLNGDAMKKTLIALAAAATVTLALSACSGAATEEAATDTAVSSNAPEGLVNPGAFTACIDPEYAPLEYYEDATGGDIIGFDADGIRALADYWGIEYKFEVTSFDGLMPGLQSGKCDTIFGGLYMTDERAEIADAAPIMNTGPGVLATPEIASTLKTKEDLCGLTVASQAASANAASIVTLSETCVADGKEPIKSAEYPKVAETVLAVINGKADALVETNVAAAYMETQNEGKLAIAPGIFEPDTTFGAFTKLDNPFTPALAEAMKALYEDGTFAKIAAVYNLDPAILDVY